MQSYSFVAFFALLAVASAGVAVLPSARIIQGPSSRTTVVGPDGSAISSVAPGGQIVQEESVGVIAETAPIVAAAPSVASLAYSAAPLVHSVVPSSVVSGYSTPLAAYSAPLAYSAPVVAHHHASPVFAQYAATPSVVAHSAVDTVVSGPSGTIVSGRSVVSPTVVSAARLVNAW